MEEFIKKYSNDKNENQFRTDIIKLLVSYQETTIFNTISTDIKEIKSILNNNELKNTVSVSVKAPTKTTNKSKSRKGKLSVVVEDVCYTFSSAAAMTYYEENKDNINISEIEASGSGDKITKKDVDKLVPKKYCEFIKKDGNNCKKRGTIDHSGQYFCSIHYKEIKKNILVEEESTDDEENNQSLNDIHEDIDKQLENFRNANNPYSLDNEDEDESLSCSESAESLDIEKEDSE